MVYHCVNPNLPLIFGFTQNQTNFILRPGILRACLVQILCKSSFQVDIWIYTWLNQLYSNFAKKRFISIHELNIQIQAPKTAAYYISPIEIGVFWLEIKCLKSATRLLNRVCVEQQGLDLSKEVLWVSWCQRTANTSLPL